MVADQIYTVVILHAQSYCTLGEYYASSKDEVCRLVSSSLPEADKVCFILKGEVADWSDKADRWTSGWKDRDFSLLIILDGCLTLRKFWGTSVGAAWEAIKASGDKDARIVGYIDGHYDFEMAATLGRVKIGRYEESGVVFEVIREENGEFSVYANNACVKLCVDADCIPSHLRA